MSNFILYRNIPEDEVISGIQQAYDMYKNKQDTECSLMDLVSQMVIYGEEHGFCGNLWADYLTDKLVNDENVYARSCEIGGSADGTIADYFLWDMKLVYDLYKYDMKGLLTAAGQGIFANILDYRANGTSHVYNSRIRDRICSLAEEMTAAESPEKMGEVLTDFYRRYGVGKFGLHKAFRVETGRDGEVNITPILKIAHVSLDDLVGYEIPKQKLVENTDAFINKRPANNCLLYGDAGTGKSSSIKAIANGYYESGLRIIEVYRHQFKYLNDVIAQIKDRNYRFIIYMDDLSFEDFETEYKYLKAVIEGGLEKKPENVLIYATSNRRHLVKETVSDRDDRDPDMHRSDTMAEKLSLSARFGVSIYFGSPDKKEFNNIVKELAGRHGIDMPEDELVLRANKWELSHGGLSGRTAQQFIDNLLGQEK